MTETVLLTADLGLGVARVTLNKPDDGNALDYSMIDALADVAAKLEEDDGVRAIVLMSEGRAFSDGYDRTWLRDHLSASRSQREADALAMLRMLAAWNHLSKPVVARVHGNAASPGIGLVCVSDIVVASDNVQFGITGSRLGLTPSLMAPFIISRIGETNCRALWLAGDWISARRARRIGLIRDTVENDEIDIVVDEVLADILDASPSATMSAKKLARHLARTVDEEALRDVAVAYADQWETPDAIEGVTAWLEDRSPRWPSEDDVTV